jgi:hypothetical protein
MKKVIVFDIDGTLANIEHRKHHVAKVPGRKPHWAAFNREMVNDTPHEDIVWLFREFADNPDVIVVIASGRGEEDREKTQTWLDTHGIYYVKLYMRPAKDSRQDSIIKREILDQIVTDFGTKPFMVFDDRNQVVDMWRENGIRCLQVAPGAF